MSRWSTALCALLLLAGSSTTLIAQTSVGIGVVAGYYRPLGHFDPTPILSTGLPKEPANLQGTALGFDGQISIGRHWGIEGSASTTGSYLPGCICPGGGGPRNGTDARVNVAVLEGQYDLSLAPSRYRLWLSAGPALVQHAGDAYAPFDSPHSWAAAFGLDLGIGLIGPLQLHANATTVIYSFDVNPDSRQSLERGRQTDALISVGLRWRQP
jgi:hypothetical protein